MSEIAYYDPDEVIRLTPGPYVWKNNLKTDRACTVPALSRKELSWEILDSTSKDQAFKADGGKINPDLLFTGMPDALKAVAAVLSYGAQKYEAHSWKRVDMARYEAALGRHMHIS